MKKQPAEAVVREIRRKTRRNFSSEDKIRIVLEGLRGEESSSSRLFPAFMIVVFVVTSTVAGG